MSGIDCSKPGHLARRLSSSFRICCRMGLRRACGGCAKQNESKGGPPVNIHWSESHFEIMPPGGIGSQIVCVYGCQPECCDRPLGRRHASGGRGVGSAVSRLGFVGLFDDVLWFLWFPGFSGNNTAYSAGLAWVDEDVGSGPVGTNLRISPLTPGTRDDCLSGLACGIVAMTDQGCMRLQLDEGEVARLFISTVCCWVGDGRKCEMLS
ncbi:hypothetical protein CGRA01v4_04781 [Colletotrichum graminicola]|nr:hypothetical protein CGRA01v4_04781 [Colletotrichum graminicola]